MGYWLNRSNRIRFITFASTKPWSGGSALTSIKVDFTIPPDLCHHYILGSRASSSPFLLFLSCYICQKISPISNQINLQQFEPNLAFHNEKLTVGRRNWTTYEYELYAVVMACNV